MSRFIAAYDIADDNQRLAVARVLLKYGERIQRSVFELWLDPEDVPPLRCELGMLLDEADHFELIPIDQSPDRSRWSWREATENFAAVNVLGR